MLVMKCSAASLILKHCAKHGRRIMSILWQPWLPYSMRSFFLMLSMMLGVEGEDGPSCNSWSTSLMCMNIIFNVSSPLLPQFSFNFFLYKVMVPIIASRHRRLLQFLVVLLWHEHYSIAKCTNFPFERVLIRRKLIPNKRVMSISSQRCNLSRRISERATFHVLAISPCTGLQIHWSWMHRNENFMELLNINFSSLYVSVHVQNLMKTAGLALKLWRCWRIWFLLWSRIYGNALSCLQNNQVHTLSPGWRSGVETNANKPSFPKLNLWHEQWNGCKVQMQS